MSGPDSGTPPDERRRFWRIAGAAFQGGAAAVDSATVVASLVYHLTGSVLAVGFASAVLRLARRFFGGGLIALVAAAFVGLTIDAMPLLLAHAAIFALTAGYCYVNFRTLQERPVSAGSGNVGCGCPSFESF